MTAPGVTGETGTDGGAAVCHSPLTRLRARMAMARERWSALSPRRKRMIAAGALMLLLRRRGAPFVQANVEIEVTFRPVATTAVSLFGPAIANPGNAAEDDD